MRKWSRWAIIATASAMAASSVAINSAAAADIPMPEGQQQPPPPNYYQGAPRYGVQPPADEGYYAESPPPAVYRYPPPPVTFYEYGPPPVVLSERYVVGPEVYAPRRRFGYAAAPYRVRGYAPYVSRHGYYDHRWNGHRW